MTELLIASEFSHPTYFLAVIDKPTGVNYDVSIEFYGLGHALNRIIDVTHYPYSTRHYSLVLLPEGHYSNVMVTGVSSVDGEVAHRELGAKLLFNADI